MPSDVRLNFFVRSNQRRGAACGLAAAALFGMSPPLAKLLLPEAGPLLIAGLLYLGAGVGLLVFERVFYRGSETSRRETQVGPSDRWLLAGIVFTGGILGPVFMLWGLQRVTGVFGSLLLNLEAPFTIVLALLLFREHLGRVEGVGAVLIIIAAALLQYRSGDLRPDVWGFFAIAGASATDPHRRLAAGGSQLWCESRVGYAGAPSVRSRTGSRILCDRAVYRCPGRCASFR